MKTAIVHLGGTPALTKEEALQVLQYECTYKHGCLRGWSLYTLDRLPVEELPGYWEARLVQ